MLYILRFSTVKSCIAIKAVHLFDIIGTAS